MNKDEIELLMNMKRIELTVLKTSHDAYPYRRPEVEWRIEVLSQQVAYLQNLIFKLEQPPTI